MGKPKKRNYTQNFMDYQVTKIVIGFQSFSKKCFSSQNNKMCLRPDKDHLV